MPTEEILTAIPHRPPFLLIDEVTDRADNAITCRKPLAVTRRHICPLESLGRCYNEAGADNNPVDDLMNTLDRITTDPAVLNGQPCIRGQRLTVRRVLEALATYPSRAEMSAEFPELEDEDIRQALEYAAAALDDRVLELK